MIKMSAVIFIFIFGLIVGSFLNALIHRLHSGESMLERHSRCPHCRHALPAADLVPILSFFALRGRCRYCRKPISWQYPLVELATAVAFVLVYFDVTTSALGNGKFPISNFQFLNYLPATTYQLIFYLVFACFLIVIFVYDLRHFLILDKVVFSASALALLYAFAQGNFLEAALGALFLSGFFGIIYLVSRGRWIGLGDVKLGIFLGLLVPFPETLALFAIAYLAGALVGMGLIAAGRKKFSDRLPFGTFLTFAAFIAMLWGKELVTWYLQLIGI